VGDAVSSLERVLTPSAAFDPATAAASFSVGMNDEASVPLLGRLLHRLRTSAPGLDLRVQPLRRDSLQALDAGRLELLVMPDVRGVPGFEAVELDRFVLKPLLRDEFVVVSRRKRRLGRAEYLEADHVVTTPLGENERSAMDVVMAREGLTRRVVLTVPTFTQAVLTVGESELVATVPRLLVAGVAPQLHLVRPPVQFRCPPQLLVWHPRHTASPGHRFVREALTSVAPR
jgi:hypothetical protein